MSMSNFTIDVRPKGGEKAIEAFRMLISKKTKRKDNRLWIL